MKKVFAMVDAFPACDADCNVICIGSSVCAIIAEMIDLGYIRGDCIINPISSGRRFFLDEYLKDWKNELPLLTQNEFNEWFNHEYEIWDFPLIE